MKRLIVSAVCISSPGTMGGNSKITIEMVRCLAARYRIHVLVPIEKCETFRGNLPVGISVDYHFLETFQGNDRRHPIRALRWYMREMDRVLNGIGANADDVLFACSDFPMESIPCFWLQRKYHYKWLPSAFLFVPFIVENLRNHYGFPPFKYLLAWVYAKFCVFFSSLRATGFVITNESDYRHFSRRFRAKRLFPYYGGVNVEQIPSLDLPKVRDVVFCSRLHPQKGIDAFLDVWKIVHERLPHVRFSVIGNGDPAYERYLKDKAVRLGIADSIDWLGYVNNESKYRVYAEARLFVHPTIFDNNGMVAAEALCTGLPVVMQDIPALRHVYTTGCAKVPFADKRAFADKIVELLSDPAKLEALAPSREQLAALRDHWRWESRAAAFSRWVETELSVLV